MCDCDCRVTLICQIQRGSVLSSVILQDDLVHPGILLGNLSERTGASDSDVKSSAEHQYDLYSSEKASFFFSSAKGAAENIDMTQKQKSQRTNEQTSINDSQLKKHSQAERQNQKRPLSRDDNR